MKPKPLEEGDLVKVEYTIDIHGHDAKAYLDGKLIEYKAGCWLVEYHLGNISEQYQNWWIEDDITTKHYTSWSDAEKLKRVDEKILASEYNGMVYYNDQYFESTHEFLEWWQDQAEYDDEGSPIDDQPEFVWACYSQPVKPNFDLESYVSEALEEEGYEGISELTKFQHLFERLNSIQKKFFEVAAKETVYYPDYKKAVML